MASRYLHANITKLSEKHLEQAIESLGKVANQRLRELEKVRTEGGLSVQYSTHSSSYAYVERLAFDKEKIKYVRVTNKGHLIFKRGTKGLSTQEKRKELQALQGFLRAETSTVSGTKKILRKSYERFNERDSVKDNPIKESTYRGFWQDSLIAHFLEMYYSEMDSLMQEADKNNLSTEDMVVIIKSLGITETMTRKEADIRGITVSDILSRMRAFHESDFNVMDGAEILNPEEL